MKDSCKYDGNNIEIYEWPQPICGIVSKDGTGCIQVKTEEDAEAIINSLEMFLVILNDMGE